MICRLPRWLPGLLAVGLVLVGCGTGAGGERRQLTVFAASSLTEAFSEVGRDFERRHPDTRVVFAFGSSATLAQQLRQGAPADVFAAANHETMVSVTTSGLAAPDPPTFARNRLQLAVPADNPGHVRDLADLARSELSVALCARQAPCGAAAQAALLAAGVRVEADTYEGDVKAAITKVVLGEVDAALVYRTDVRAAGDRVRGIDLPAAAQVVNDYPIAVLKTAGNPQIAAAFVAYLRSPGPGRHALIKAGFETP